jgi:hypothetical protein
MASQAAKIVDLATYRRERQMAPSAAPALPMCYVTWWTFVPVVLVPGYYA